MFDLLKIDPSYRSAIRESWHRNDASLYGRFDFAYDGTNLKMLELNFDTPASVYEAAILQWAWLEEKKGTDGISQDADQFNQIHQRLVETFAQLIPEGAVLHFASVHNCREEEDTVKYMQSCAALAGIETKFIHMRDVRWNSDGEFFDADQQPITHLFKLYPWEFLFAEDLDILKLHGRHVLPPTIVSRKVSFLEPAWKSILSNKACLPLLWQMAPNHPFLLEATFDDLSSEASALRNQPHVRKPIFGREGGSVSIIIPGEEQENVANPSGYGAEGFVLQRLQPLAQYEGYHLVLGSWVINGEPAGLGIRADKSKITGTGANFIPHYVQPPAKQAA
jgi:glutathionylspermidine synthase